MNRLLALLLLVPATRAGEVCHDQAWPFGSTNWSQSFVLPKHDPALGALQSVTLLVRAATTISAQFENFDVVSSPVRLSLLSRTTLRRPDASTIVVAEPRVGVCSTFWPSTASWTSRGPRASLSRR